MAQLSNDITYNVFAVKLADPARTKELVQSIPQNVARVEAADLVTAYKKTPGYTEQQATLETQRIFTLIIGVLVVGGFFQIQMLQKVPQIGMLKAIGARNRTVAGAVILQVTLVTMHRRGDWHGADAAAGGELPGLGADRVPREFNRHRDCVAVTHRPDRRIGVRPVFAAD